MPVRPGAGRVVEGSGGTSRGRAPCPRRRAPLSWTSCRGKWWYRLPACTRRNSSARCRPDPLRLPCGAISGGLAAGKRSGAPHPGKGELGAPGRRGTQPMVPAPMLSRCPWRRNYDSIEQSQRLHDPCHPGPLSLAQAIPVGSGADAGICLSCGRAMPTLCAREVVMRARCRPGSDRSPRRRARTRPEQRCRPLRPDRPGAA